MAELIHKLGVKYFLIIIIFLEVSWKVTGSESPSLDTLQLVQVLLRHGDRNQIFSYPSFPPVPVEKNAILTNIGKLQTYNLGVFLRNRYKTDFINAANTPGQITVISSDLERTVVSAQMVLAGFYRLPNASNVWNSLSDFIPDIPITIIEKSEDNLIKLSKSCPKLKRLLKELRQSTSTMKLNMENHELLAYVNGNTGANATSVFDIDYIGDILTVKKAHHEKLAEWEENVFVKMQEIYDVTMKLETSTTPLKRLKSGPLLKLISQNFQDVHIYSKNTTRLIMYSGHDDIMVSIRNSLAIDDSTHPPYGAALILELHQSLAYNNESFVKIFYRNETGQAPYRLIIPNCGSPCFLHRLVDLTKPVTPENWDQECMDTVKPKLSNALTEVNPNPTSNQGYLVLSSVIVFFAMGAILAVYLIKTRNSCSYEPL